MSSRSGLVVDTHGAACEIGLPCGSCVEARIRCSPARWRRLGSGCGQQARAVAHAAPACQHRALWPVGEVKGSLLWGKAG